MGRCHLDLMNDEQKADTAGTQIKTKRLFLKLHLNKALEALNFGEIHPHFSPFIVVAKFCLNLIVFDYILSLS